MTCSFGVVLLDVNETLFKALNRADELLYKAKEAGRNNVKF
ncbi:MAG: diguanylate cyclase domain-containing protein [Plesiomonas shigelloides]